MNNSRGKFASVMGLNLAWLEDLDDINRVKARGKIS